jgi:hypothetical protein
MAMVSPAIPRAIRPKAGGGTLTLGDCLVDGGGEGGATPSDPGAAAVTNASAVSGIASVTGAVRGAGSGSGGNARR